MDISRALTNARKHTAAVQRLEFALRKNPQDPRLSLGLGSARRRARRSQEILEAFAQQQQVDLIRYRLLNSDDFYPIEAVADSVSAFQKSFTGAADFLESGPKAKARYAHEIESRTRLNLAYTYPGSLGMVLAVENERDLFLQSGMDGIVEVFSQFLEVADENSAVDASRRLGSALITQLCKWVDVNAKWENSVDYVVSYARDVQRGEHVPKNKFFDLSDIFHGAKDEEPHTFKLAGMLVGLDTNDRRFHFVVPGGPDYKGSLSEEFGIAPTTVPGRYAAQITEKVTRVVATGKESRSRTLVSLVPYES